MPDNLMAVNVNDGTVTDAAGLYLVPEPDEATLAAILEDSARLAAYAETHGAKYGPAALPTAREVEAAALLEEVPSALVTADGGRLSITGAVERSSTSPGLLSVEVECGTLYLDPESTVRIQP